MAEQPKPVRSDRPEIQGTVIEELHTRWKVGRERYGTGLQVGNGRRMSQDFLEEIQDALVYATGIREQDNELGRILTHLLELHHRAPGMDTCVICVQPHPCHTAVDVDRALGVLGIRKDTPR